MASSPRRRRSGVLSVIATLLIVSGAIRIGSGTSSAFAADAVPPAPAEAGAEIETACAPTEAPAELLAALRTREERVATQESQIADRMQALRLAETEIEEKLAALQAAESSLADTLNIARGAAAEDIGRLTAVYENMPPEEVASLFEEMDPEFSSGFLARMAPEAAAAVMTNLSPTTAYSISVVIAGRNANAPRE